MKVSDAGADPGCNKCVESKLRAGAGAGAWPGVLPQNIFNNEDTLMCILVYFSMGKQDGGPDPLHPFPLICTCTREALVKERNGEGELEQSI